MTVACVNTENTQIQSHSWPANPPDVWPELDSSSSQSVYFLMLQIVSVKVCLLCHDDSLFVLLLSLLSVPEFRNQESPQFSGQTRLQSSDKSGNISDKCSVRPHEVTVSLCLRLGSGCLCDAGWDDASEILASRMCRNDWSYDVMTAISADIFVPWLMQVRIQLCLDIPASVVDRGQSRCEPSLIIFLCPQNTDDIVY